MKDKKKVAIGVFIVFLMVSSGIGLFYGSTVASPSVKHRGLVAVSTDNGWLIKGDNLRARSLFNPADLEDIEVRKFPYDIVNSKDKLYVSFNPNDNLVVVLNEINNLLASGLQVQAFPACYEEFEGCENLPLKTCNDVGSDSFLIKLEKNEEANLVLYRENCIELEGSTIWMARALDKMVLLNYYTE